MKFVRANFGRSMPANRWLVVVCLLLLSISVLAASHFHPDDSGTTAKHCPICQAAHSPVQITVLALPQVVFATSTYLVVAHDCACRSTFYPGWHFSRPPPQA